MAPRVSVVAASMVGLCLAGCHSWQAAGFPMQNATRVPPPGTGTYHLPNGYYNNSGSTSSLAPQNPPLQAVAGGMRPASGSMPTTNLYNTTPAVSTASFSAPTTGSPASMSTSTASSVPPTASAPTAAVPNQQFTELPQGDVPTTTDNELPNLQWQQFNAH